MSAGSTSRPVVYAALTGNLLIAATKFGAALWTGSSAMLSESVHSLVDTGNQALILYGMRQADRPPDDSHPLGYGRELYFWSFIVALLLFTLGAGVSLYEGIAHIANPEPITDPVVNYIVITCSAVFEFVSWFMAVRVFHRTKGPLSYFEAFRRSKNPPLFLVLLEDTAALIGLALALAGTIASTYFDMPVLDGVASLGISALLAVAAIVLARESKELLIGEPAGPRITGAILDVARGQAGVERVNGLLTIHLAPDQVVAALSLEFSDRLTTPDIESGVATLQHRLSDKLPEIIAVFVTPQSREQFRHFRNDETERA